MQGLNIKTHLFYYNQVTDVFLSGILLSFITERMHSDQRIDVVQYFNDRSEPA
jgi:hypothetical protein